MIKKYIYKFFESLYLVYFMLFFSMILLSLTIIGIVMFNHDNLFNLGMWLVNFVLWGFNFIMYLENKFIEDDIKELETKLINNLN